MTGNQREPSMVGWAEHEKQVQEAVMAERERCALIAESDPAAAAVDIADEIRRGK